MNPTDQQLAFISNGKALLRIWPGGPPSVGFYDEMQHNECERHGKSIEKKPT